MTTYNDGGSACFLGFYSIFCVVCCLKVLGCAHTSCAIGMGVTTFLPAYRPRVMIATRPTLRNFIIVGECLSLDVGDQVRQFQCGLHQPYGPRQALIGYCSRWRLLSAPLFTYIPASQVYP